MDSGKAFISFNMFLDQRSEVGRINQVTVIYGTPSSSQMFSAREPFHLDRSLSGIRLFQWETLVLGLDPLIRSPLALFTDRSDFAVPPFGGGVGEILHGYFDPDIIAGFVVPNVPPSAPTWTWSA